jgi:hypothetical protein
VRVSVARLSSAAAPATPRGQVDTCRFTEHCQVVWEGRSREAPPIPITDSANHENALAINTGMGCVIQSDDPSLQNFGREGFARSAS